MSRVRQVRKWTTPCDSFSSKMCLTDTERFITSFRPPLQKTPLRFISALSLFVLCLQVTQTRNSSADEIANVNFLRRRRIRITKYKKRALA